MRCSVCKHVMINKKCKFCSKKKCKPCGNINCFFCHDRTFASEPSIVEEWSALNLFSPNMIWKTSKQKVLRKCKKCSREYLQSANNMLSHGCILCNNISEKKVFDFLKNEKYDFEYQIKFPWSAKFTFDFCIDNNIIIEIDGPQHFKPIKSWSSGWEIMHNDVAKENLALEHNYFVIRIAQKHLYNEEWKIFLHDNITKIKKKEITPCIITQNCKEYYSGIYKRLHTDTFFF